MQDAVPFAAFFEVDFPDLVRRKSTIIAANPQLLTVLQTETFSVVVDAAGEICSKQYRLLGCDLQDIAGLHRRLLAHGCNFTAPTLLLSECVLTYVPCRYN